MSGNNVTETTGRLRRSGVVLSRYFRRLLSPPLPGDGFLLVGFLEGLIGWSLSYLFLRNPGLAPFGLVPSIVGIWVLLTVGIVFVGITYTAPTVRRNRVWLVWGALNVLATVVNLIALAGGLPSSLLAYAYWHPWIAVLGIGYLVTAVDNWQSPQIRRQERLVYAASGIGALLVLLVSITAAPPVIVGYPFVIGGVLHLFPIGYDVMADALLIARRQ